MENDIEFDTYRDKVTDEICFLGMAYCEEGIDYSNAKEDMYNDTSNMKVFFKQGIRPEKAAEMIFSLHVHPIIF